MRKAAYHALVSGRVDRASMGPQLDSCGKLVVCDAYAVHRCASMGPQLDSCGKVSAMLTTPRAIGLQWGRNLIVAERRGLHVNYPTCEASMGPQLDSCGKFCGLYVRVEERHALQWGRNLIVAESGTCRSTRGSSRWLQWGRNLIVAESIDARPCAVPADPLQWGRNLIVAESVIGPARPARTIRFNGAAT